MKLHSEKAALILIIFLALFLRIVNINNNPPALYGDELTIVLDAKSILTTGKDQTGVPFPMTFSMGAGRPAGYVYGSIPFVAVFGGSALGVRGLSILSGIGIVFLLYILGKKFFSTKVGLIAAFLTAISPWDLSLSRGGFEAHFGLFLALLSVTTFLTADKKGWLYIISALAFIFSIHTYPTFKLTLPLVFILIIWYKNGFKNISFKKLGDKSAPLILVAAIVLAGGILSIFQTFTGGSETRFWNINIFADDDLRKSITENINIDRNDNALPRIYHQFFHNKFLEYPLILGEAYLKNFSLDFLFLHGDKNPRHNMTTSGGFYLIEILTILIGFVLLFKKRKEFILILGWISVAPLATAILLEPHFLRSSFMLPPLILLSATGVTYLLNDWNIKNTWKYILVGIFMIQVLILFERLYFLAPNKFSSFWAYPAKQGSMYILENQDQYSNVIVSDRVDNIEFAFPVYAKVDPNIVIEQNQTRVTRDGYVFKKFGKVYIGSIPEVDLGAYLARNPETLYIGSIEEKDALKDYDIILGKDGTPGFLTVTNKHLR